MRLSSLFEEQRAVEERQRIATERAITMLCIDTGSSWLALPLENAKEVVENPHVVGYPVTLKRHVGIVNVRGTVIPVVSLGARAEDTAYLVVMESPDRHPFALIARDVRRISITDAAVGAKSRSPAPLTGVISIEGKPIRWVTVAWLAEKLFGEASE